MIELLAPFVIFVVLNAVLFSTANTIVWRFFENELRDVFDWILLFFVFVTTEVLLVMSVIGFLGHFSFFFLIVGTLLCFLPGGLRLPFFGRYFQLGFLEAWRKLRHLFFRQDSSDGYDWVWGVFGFLILLGAVEFFNAFVQFPWEYDTIAYHMPILVEWVKSGSLWEIFYAVWGGPLGYYPANHELLLSWLVLPFGNDYLVNLSNFWIVGVMLVVIYKLLKEMGVSDFLSWFGGALVMVMPLFLRQLGTGQVDLLMATGMVMAWYFFLRTFKRKDGLLLFPTLFILAIVLGAKYLSIIYMLPIVVVFFFLWKSWRKQSRIWYLWFFIILGSLGSIWYWRNLILTGNPIYPAEVRLGDWIVFSGYEGLTERIQQLTLWARITDSGEFSEWIRVMIQETGWHLYLVVVAYVLLIIEMISKLLFSQMKRGEGKIYTLMLFFLPAYWYLYFIAPYTAHLMSANARYGMPWLILSMIMVVYVVHKMGFARRAFVMALLGVVWWQFLSLVQTIRSGNQLFLEFEYVYRYPWYFVGLFGVFLMFFLSFDAWRKKLSWRYPVFLTFLCSSFVFFILIVPVREELRSDSWHHKYQFALMDAYQWLDENVASDAVIANSFNPLYYPLYGSELDRKVRYVNINSCESCTYFDYQQLGMTIRDDADYDAWLSNLKSFGADYIVLGYSVREGLDHIRLYEQEWVQEHPEQFVKVFQEEDVRIYEFRNL